jgi:cytochrome b
MPIWDLPLRLFHWLLALAVTGAVVTGWLGGNLMVWHGRLGALILGLIAFRLVWGVLGTPTARFHHFVRGPAAIRAYLTGRWHGIGHNPLGALSVVAMLLVIGLQALSGHFARDDIAFNGPLVSLVGNATSDRITRLHRLGADLVLILVALHVMAIAYYRLVRKQDLIGPMLTGGRQDIDAAAGPRQGGGIVAVLVALTVAAVTIWAFQGGWITPPADAVADPAFDW